MSAKKRVLEVDGEAVLAYSVYDGPPPVAEEATPLADLDVVIPAVLEQLAGWWLASENDALTDSLLDVGARVVRHGHLYRRPIVPEDANITIVVPDGFALTPLSASAHDLAAVANAAYDADHPDFDSEHDDEEDLAGLLAGTVLGPFASDLSWQVTDGDTLVAACVINRSRGTAPFGGPWVSDLFRLPGSRYRGLGAVLLKKTITSLAEAGESSLGLVVTDGNPAAQLYERLGFRLDSSRRKIEIPGG